MQPTLFFQVMYYVLYIFPNPSTIARQNGVLDMIQNTLCVHVQCAYIER